MRIINKFAVRNSTLKLEWGDLTEPRNFVADLSRTDAAIHVEYKKYYLPICVYISTNANSLQQTATDIIYKVDKTMITQTRHFVS